MIDLLTLLAFAIGWMAIGIIAFRIVYYFAPPNESDENFFLGAAVIFGPLWAAIAIAVGILCLIIWFVELIHFPKLIRKVAGLDD